MKSSKLRMLMLTLIAAGPLASAPALASGNQGNFWNYWNQIMQWIKSNYGTSGGTSSSGTGTSLPGPGALGLVVIGLGTGIIVARRKKQ